MLIAALLALAVVILILGSLYSIVRNVQHAQTYRDNLRAHLGDLRLNRLLGVFGIVTDDYLHREPIVAIAKQMHNCSACTAADQCERALEQPAEKGTFGFCPNYAALQTHAGLA